MLKAKFLCTINDWPYCAESASWPVHIKTWFSWNLQRQRSRTNLWNFDTVWIFTGFYPPSDHLVTEFSGCGVSGRAIRLSFQHGHA